jgi:hypothetical protein
MSRDLDDEELEKAEECEDDPELNAATFGDEAETEDFVWDNVALA